MMRLKQYQLKRAPLQKRTFQILYDAIKTGELLKTKAKVILFQILYSAIKTNAVRENLPVSSMFQILYGAIIRLMNAGCIDFLNLVFQVIYSAIKAIPLSIKPMV